MPAIEVTGVAAVVMLHARGKVAFRRFDEQMVVLCEAPNYVKWAVFLLCFYGRILLGMRICFT